MNTTKEGCKEKTIIMVGNGASSAALDILKNNKEDLEKRYSLSYLENARTRLEEEKKLSASGIESCNLVSFACSSGGVFEALWKLGEAMDTGLMVEQSQIPILQCTIELCDYMDINPYEADSDGCILLVTDEPGRILDRLSEDGRVAVIGYTTDTKARIIKGSTVRYLTKI